MTCWAGTGRPSRSIFVSSLAACHRNAAFLVFVFCCFFSARTTSIHSALQSLNAPNWIWYICCWLVAILHFLNYGGVELIKLSISGHAAPRVLPSARSWVAAPGLGRRRCSGANGGQVLPASWGEQPVWDWRASGLLASWVAEHCDPQFFKAWGQQYAATRGGQKLSSNSVLCFAESGQWMCVPPWRTYWLLRTACVL